MSEDRTGLTLERFSMSERKKVIIAVVGSILLHFLIIGGITEINAILPQPAPGSAPAVEQLPEMTMLDAPPAKPQERQYVRTNDDQKTDQKPLDPPFESDKDTAAASEQPAKGTDPVPTQDGRDLKGLTFRDEDFSLDTKGQDFSRIPEQQASSQSAPTPAPTPTPSPTPTPRPTPSPQATPEKEELALLRPTPTPLPTPSTAARASAVRPSQGAPRTAYRPQSMLNRMQGSISNRGRSAVGAIGTPQGRFHKAVEDAIGSLWYRYVSQHSDLMNVGTVQIVFQVQPNGKVVNTRVVSNTSDAGLENFSIQSILDAEIPPMPPELAAVVQGEGMEFTESFAIVPR